MAHFRAQYCRCEVYIQFCVSLRCPNTQPMKPLKTLTPICFDSNHQSRNVSRHFAQSICTSKGALPVHSAGAGSMELMAYAQIQLQTHGPSLAKIFFGNSLNISFHALREAPNSIWKANYQLLCPSARTIWSDKFGAMERCFPLEFFTVHKWCQEQTS